MSRRKQPWEREQSSGKRKVNSRSPLVRFLIICEGEKTEPNYFKSFPVESDVFKIDVRCMMNY